MSHHLSHEGLLLRWWKVRHLLHCGLDLLLLLLQGLLHLLRVLHVRWRWARLRRRRLVHLRWHLARWHRRLRWLGRQRWVRRHWRGCHPQRLRRRLLWASLLRGQLRRRRDLLRRLQVCEPGLERADVYRPGQL